LELILKNGINRNRKLFNLGELRKENLGISKYQSGECYLEEEIHGAS